MSSYPTTHPRDLDDLCLASALKTATLALGLCTTHRPSVATLVVDQTIVGQAAASRRRSALAELKAQYSDLKLADGLHLLCEPHPAEVEYLAAWPNLNTVQVSSLDPSLEGRGVEALRKKAFVQVGVTPRVVSHHFKPHFWASLNGRPRVLLKVASSLDGRSATRTRESQWITGPEARAYGRKLRSRVDAILVGVGTVLADDPQLTARIEGQSDPLRVILDGRGRVPPEARVVQTAREAPTYIATSHQAPASVRERWAELGVQVELCPVDETGRLVITGVMSRLYALGVRHVLVEGGATVAGAFVDAKLVDDVAWFMAMKLIGGEGAQPAVRGLGVGPLSEAIQLANWTSERVGSDLLVTGEVI